MAQRQAPRKLRTPATRQRGWPVPTLLLLQLLAPCACYGMTLLRGSSATHVGHGAQAPAYGSRSGIANTTFPAPHTHGAYGHGGMGYGHGDGAGGAPQGEVGAGGVGTGGSGPALPLPPLYPLLPSPTPSPFPSPPPSTIQPPPSYPPLAPPSSCYPPSGPPPNPPPPPAPPSPPPLHSSPSHTATPASPSPPPQLQEPPDTPPQPSASPLNLTTPPGAPLASATPPATQPPALPPVQPPPAPIPIPANTSGPVAFLAVPSSLIDPANPSAVLVVQTDVLLLNTQATDREALSVLFPGAATVTPVAQSVQATLAMEPKPEAAGPSAPIQAACVQLATQVEDLRRTLQAAYPASEVRVTCFSSSSTSSTSTAAAASPPSPSPSTASNTSAASPSSLASPIPSPSAVTGPVRRSLSDTESSQRGGLLGPTGALEPSAAAASAPSQLIHSSSNNVTTRPAGSACATSLQVTVRSPLVGTPTLAPRAGPGASASAPAGGSGAVTMAAAADGGGGGGGGGVPEGVYGKLDTWGGGQASSYGVSCGIKLDVSTQVRAEYRVPLSSAGQDALRPSCSGGAGSGGSLLFLASGSAAADATTSCTVVLAAADASGTAGPVAPGAPVADLAAGGAASGPASAVLPAAVAAGVGTALAAVLVAAVVALRRKRRRDAQEELEADINKARTQPSYIDVWSSEGSAPRRPLPGSSTSTGRTLQPASPSPLTAESSTPSAGTPQRVVTARSGSQALASARPPLRGRALILYQQTLHQGEQQQQLQQQHSGMLPPHSRPSRLRTHSCDDAGLQLQLQRRALMQRRATMERERPSRMLRELSSAAGAAAGGVPADEKEGLDSEASGWASRRGSEGPGRGASWDAVMVAARAREGPTRPGAGAGAGGLRAAVRGPVILEREEAREDPEQLREGDSPVLPGSGECSGGGSIVSGDVAGVGSGGGVRGSRGALAARRGSLGATHPLRPLRHDADKLEALRVALGAATRSPGRSAESGANGNAAGGGAREQASWSAMLRRSSNRVHPQQQSHQSQQQQEQQQRGAVSTKVRLAPAEATASSPLLPLPPAAWDAVPRAEGLAAVQAGKGAEAGGAAAERQQQ